MDASEAIAQKLLTHMGFTSVVYEPRWGMFRRLLADKIVEVRRLNQESQPGTASKAWKKSPSRCGKRLKGLSIHLSTDQRELVRVRPL